MSKPLSESENSKPLPLVWLGPLLALAIPISHPAFFVQWAIFRDTTWCKIPLLITAMILSALGLRRTWTAAEGAGASASTRASGASPICMSALEGLRDSTEELRNAGAEITAVNPAPLESRVADIPRPAVSVVEEGVIRWSRLTDNHRIRVRPETRTATLMQYTGI